jgi:hypothetical protein
LAKVEEKSKAHRRESKIEIVREPVKPPTPKNPVFGTSGAFHDAKYSDLSSKDRSEIQSQSTKEGAGANNDFFPLALRPNLGRELEDKFIASTISMKFVAFKTLDARASATRLPQRVFFTTKFYSFKESRSDVGLLRLPLQVAKDL